MDRVTASLGVGSTGVRVGVTVCSFTQQSLALERQIDWVAVPVEDRKPSFWPVLCVLCLSLRHTVDKVSTETMRSLKKSFPHTSQPKVYYNKWQNCLPPFGVLVKRVRKWWMTVKTQQSLVRHFAKFATYRDNAVLPAFFFFFFCLFWCLLFRSIHSEIQCMKMRSSRVIHGREELHDFTQETLNVADVFEWLYHYYCVRSTPLSCCCTACFIVFSRQLFWKDMIIMKRLAVHIISFVSGLLFPFL